MTRSFECHPEPLGACSSSSVTRDLQGVPQTHREPTSAGELITEVKTGGSAGCSHCVRAVCDPEGLAKSRNFHLFQKNQGERSLGNRFLRKRKPNRANNSKDAFGRV